MRYNVTYMIAIISESKDTGTTVIKNIDGWQKILKRYDLIIFLVIRKLL